MISEFLQSKSWGELQKNIGNKIWQLNIDNQSILIIQKKLPLGKSYLYVPRAPFINDIKSFIKKITEIAKQEKSIFLKIEPTPIIERSAFTAGLAQNNQELIDTLIQNGFVKSSSIQPEQTLLIDLSQPKEIFLKEMAKQTRQGIRYAEERKVQIIKEPRRAHKQIYVLGGSGCSLTDRNGLRPFSNKVRPFIPAASRGEFSAASVKADILHDKEQYFENFWRLFEATNQRHGLDSYSKNYYRQIISLNNDCQSELFLAKINNEIIGAIIVLFYKDTAAYLYAASATGYSKFNAPTLLIWNAILDAKEKGYKFFDFWGISDTKKNWRGITTFKKSFGGKEYRYPGAFDFIFDKKFYWIYKIAKKLKEPRRVPST